MSGARTHPERRRPGHRRGIASLGRRPARWWMAGPGDGRHTRSLGWMAACQVCRGGRAGRQAGRRVRPTRSLWGACGRVLSAAFPSSLLTKAARYWALGAGMRLGPTGGRQERGFSSVTAQEPVPPRRAVTLRSPSEVAACCAVSRRDGSERRWDKAKEGWNRTVHIADLNSQYPREVG